MKEVTDGMKKYESLINIICNTNDISLLSDNEWEGALGVACVMSVLDGIKPSFFDISKHLGIKSTNKYFDNAFKRLKINRIFSNEYNVTSDNLLAGKSKDTQWKKSSERNLFAWCHIAGIAGGNIGLKS